MLGGGGGANRPRATWKLKASIKTERWPSIISDHCLHKIYTQELKKTPENVLLQKAQGITTASFIKLLKQAADNTEFQEEQVQKNRDGSDLYSIKDARYSESNSKLSDLLTLNVYIPFPFEATTTRRSKAPSACVKTV